MDYYMLEQFSLKRMFCAVIGVQMYWMVSSFVSSMWWTPTSVT